MKHHLLLALLFSLFPYFDHIHRHSTMDESQGAAGHVGFRGLQGGEQQPQKARGVTTRIRNARKPRERPPRNIRDSALVPVRSLPRYTGPYYVRSLPGPPNELQLIYVRLEPWRLKYQSGSLETLEISPVTDGTFWYSRLSS